MKIKSEKDFWSGLMFVSVGIAFAWGAANYSFGPACPPADACASSLWARFTQLSARPGPAFFPFGLGVLMAVLGGLILFKSLTIEVEGGGKLGAWAWKPLLVTVGAVASFGWTLPHLGMVAALPILVFIASIAGDEFHWRDALINSVLLTIGSWLIFIYGLKLTIPLWPSFLAG